eukprot:TRINITY_DN59_c0_g1_i3.p1 TRINITY_DN59_c0_g1~~TRINITY_DN59_c0_g1_i3.p1  ORF type:complete len:127 (-),score=26.36 TRINITY_DN59_c0_g1_i3:146-526(-)
MSWQTFVDTNLLGTKKITKAAFIRHNGALLSKSGNINFTPQEAKNIADGFRDNFLFHSAGIVLEGTKYTFLRSQDRSVIGKKGQGGIHLTSTTNAIIIAIYEAPTIPSEAAIVVEKLADYLIGVGY